MSIASQFLDADDFAKALLDAANAKGFAREIAERKAEQLFQRMAERRGYQKVSSDLIDASGLDFRGEVHALQSAVSPIHKGMEKVSGVQL
jgi:ActR/RegA family two-component response regulator